MTLEQYAYLAEILGVIIIVVTLLYLSVQVRQGAHALLATSREATMTAELGFLSKCMDYPEIAMGFGDSGLTAEEIRLTTYLVSYLRIREFAWFQYQNGILDDTTWESYMAPTVGVFASDTARGVWNSDAIKMDPGFMAYVDNLLEESVGNPRSEAG